jgi:hypothetical protein
MRSDEYLFAENLCRALARDHDALVALLMRVADEILESADETAADAVPQKLKPRKVKRR